MLLEHNKDRRLYDIIHAAVKEMYVPAILGRRSAIVWRPFGEVPHEHPRDKHGFDVRVRVCVVVGVFSVPSKVTTWVWIQTESIKYIYFLM